MPQKIKKGQLFFDEDIVFYPLGESIEMELDKDCETSEDSPVFKIGGSYEFTAEMQPPERMTMGDVLLMLYGFDAEKLKQNNWRKMHGMVIHRKVWK